MTYRVISAFKGVRRGTDDSFRFVTLEPGEAFTLRGDERDGQVSVIYQGYTVSVFTQDIRERAAKVREAARRNVV